MARFFCVFIPFLRLDANLMSYYCNATVILSGHNPPRECQPP
ncbi:Uncharacterized protein ChrSW_1412 [Chromobacterium vaccinii]|nr:Uncharacterized protein ChrSW_1412 [Chromobacterium vaccinii]